MKKLSQLFNSLSKKANRLPVEILAFRPHCRGKSLIISVVFFVFTLVFQFYSVRASARRDVQSVLSTLAAVRGYQGLLLDSNGLASVLIGLVENTSLTSLKIQELEFKRDDKVYFLQNFGAEKGYFAYSWLRKINPSIIQHHSQFEAFELRFLLKISPKIYVKIFISSFSVGLLILLLLVTIHYFQTEKNNSLVLKMQAEMKEEIALQIAHDIRSPLAALSMLNKQLELGESLDSDSVEILKLSIQRVGEISNNLLQTNREALYFEVSSLLSNLIKEKRIEINSEISICFHNALANAYTVKGRASDIKRVISNLINNSADALVGILNPEIQVMCELFETRIKITIKDNGKGIPAEILEKIGQKGSSFGKVGGNGIGLYHAKRVVFANSGSFSIQSTPEKGTEIYFTLPIYAS